jgi:hypothetical protein
MSIWQTNFNIYIRTGISKFIIKEIFNLAVPLNVYHVSSTSTTLTFNLRLPFLPLFFPLVDLSFDI